jgi:hypothetical protein
MFTIVPRYSLAYSYSKDESYADTKREAMTDDGTILSSNTVSEYFKVFRDAIFYDYVNRANENPKLGGPGKIVQIDEAKVSSGV